MADYNEYDESTANIVDGDLLEAAKENVQPLATGRRVTALSAILATPHAQREAKLSATRNRLRINVELALDDEDGDPLEAYCRLVYWTLENYPQGHSAESGLLELLEEATRVLKDDREGKWRGDIKYLKLWLLYASYVEKPTIIYKFLIANEIGAQHALLYEEHAAVLERDRRRKEADEAYSLGIARKAQPLEHLESRYDDFQKRMMSNLTLPAAAQPTAATSSRAPRQALATTLVTSTSAAASTSLLSAQATRPASSRTPSGNPSALPNGRLQIFMDPSGEEAQAAEAGANEWNDLGTRKTRIKENVPEVKKMVGSTIKQAGKSKRLASASGTAGGSSSSSSSKIAIFRDPAPGDMSPPPVPMSSTQKKSPVVGTPKVGFMPFVDGPQDSEGSSTSAASPPPSTPAPKFTPFRDEAAVDSPAAAAVLPVADSIMKIKKTDKSATEPTSEAEALRKDPLKNYSSDDRGVVGQGD